MQIQQLAEVMRIIDSDIFSKVPEPYYILIDKLDENWIDDIRRYKLIRALIESVKRFRVVHNVKIIVALRNDLIERVYRETRDSGFQEEKYEDLHLRLRWSPQELYHLLDKRIGFMMESVYTKQNVKFSDVFPKTVCGKPCVDYIIERTLLRPRDAIAFVNEILGAAEGRTKITETVIQDAEGLYSQKRLNALCDEWIVDSPQLIDYFGLIKKREARFSHHDVTPATCYNVLGKLIDKYDDESRDIMLSAAGDVCENRLDVDAFKIQVLRILYKIGILGVKPDTHVGFTFSGEGPAEMQAEQIANAVRFEIHPMLWRALGVHPGAG